MTHFRFKERRKSKQDTSLKGDHVMKLFLFAVTALLALANGATAARALSSNHAVLAKVPFSFSVGQDQLPSGTYTLSQDPWGLVTLQSLDRSITLIISKTDDPCSMSGDKLVFRKYGDHYFLSSVSSSVLSAHFPVSKLEKTMRQQMTGEGQIAVAAR
jgi:hypothetical protein